jgi:hypothetical protein
MLLPFGVPLVAMLIYQYAAPWLSPLLAGDLYAFCFGCMGLAILAYAIVITAMSLRASAWPTTPGRITSSGEEKVNTYDEGVTVKYCVTYDYEVNGQRYGGGRVTVAFPFSSNISWLSKRTLTRYPKRTLVNVRYNPKNPRESVLHPWTAGQVVIWLIAAGLIVLAWRLGVAR